MIKSWSAHRPTNTEQETLFAYIGAIYTAQVESFGIRILFIKALYQQFNILITLWASVAQRDKFSGDCIYFFLWI